MSSQPLLILAGLGHAHLFVLEQLTAWRRAPNTAPLPVTSALSQGRILLVTPSTDTIYSGMVPGVISGRYTAAQTTLNLKALIENSGVRHLQGSVSTLAADTNTLTVTQSDQQITLSYDLLSLNVGGAMPAQACDAAIPGSSTRALALRPMERFLTLWPRLSEQANQSAQTGTTPYSIAVLGAGAGGIEVAMAAAHALPSASVSLISGERPIGHFGSQRFAQHVRAALARAGVHVLPLRVMQMSEASEGRTELHLSGGARMLCHAPILATGSRPHAWLSACGLALDEQGFVAVGPSYQSTSHPNVFAAGDVCARADTALPRSGVGAVRAGPALAQNLGLALAGMEPRAHALQTRYLYLVSSADGRAVAQWGPWSAEGRWVMALKNRIDLRFMQRFNHPS